MQIKTLNEILAEEGIITHQQAKTNNTSKQRRQIQKKAVKNTQQKSKKCVKVNADIIDKQEKKQKNNLDNITAQLTLKSEEEKQAELDEIKATKRLRWLAFYYLSTREHSSNELREKLLKKQQNPEKIEELLQEFAKKGYQSDERTAFMLIREGIRKGRGRNRIKQDFYKRKITLPTNIDELIDMANAETAEFNDFIDMDKGEEQVNWLKLAVEARVKKYGHDIPTEPKEKARQLRFLQYRGFQTDICFEALKFDTESLEQEFHER
ncbi:MAG: regulatory protein RecX [Moraxellaceae bacterium]|nr:regulatory protein RecX [Moraxellaceae bacterium]